MSVKRSGNKTSLGMAAAGLFLVAGTLNAATPAAAGKARAEQLFNDNCASCHGQDLGGYLAPPLNKDRLAGRSATGLRSMVMTGVFDTLMPPFYGKLSDDDIRLVVNRIMTTPKEEVNAMISMITEQSIIVPRISFNRWRQPNSLYTTIPRNMA